MDDAPRRPKPLITANQVTFTRLAFLPVGCWLLYQGERGQWIALVFMTLVGCTDFVDGWLARRYGPTVLGGLMDPIADKVFISVTLLPTIDLGWLPYYFVLLVFLREFVITAARTAYERRKVPLRSSYLAKVKTWYQMIFAAILFLLNISPPTLRAVTLAGALGAALGGPLYYLVRRRVWRGSVVFTFSFGLMYLLERLGDAHQITTILGWSVVGITWASGAAYLVGMRDLAGKGRIDRQDLIRLFGSVALPVIVCLLAHTHRAPSWALIATLALEFAVGGLDNLLAHHGLLPSAAGWALRVIPQCALLGGALYLALAGQAAATVIFALCVTAFAITLLSVAYAFVRYRDAYLGVRANAPLAVAPSTSSTST